MSTLGLRMVRIPPPGRGLGLFVIAGIRMGFLFFSMEILAICLGCLVLVFLLQRAWFLMVRQTLLFLKFILRARSIPDKRPRPSQSGGAQYSPDLTGSNLMDSKPHAQHLLLVRPSRPLWAQK